MFDDGMFFISGPPPILPRPTPYSAPQAYALIPIPNVNQSFNTASPSPAQQQVLLNLTQSGPMSACPSPIISEGMIITEANWICIPKLNFCNTCSSKKENVHISAYINHLKLNYWYQLICEIISSGLLNFSWLQYYLFWPVKI